MDIFEFEYSQCMYFDALLQQSVSYNLLPAVKTLESA